MPKKRKKGAKKRPNKRTCPCGSGRRLDACCGNGGDLELGPFTTYTVTQVKPGQGFWVLGDAGGDGDELLWIDDEEASYLYEPGTWFGTTMRRNGKPFVPICRSCPECREKIRAGRALNQAATRQAAN